MPQTSDQLETLTDFSASGATESQERLAKHGQKSPQQGNGALTPPPVNGSVTCAADGVYRNGIVVHANGSVRSSAKNQHSNGYVAVRICTYIFNQYVNE